MEIELTGTNPEAFPELATWGWPVAAYLFLGGLVAGLMILSAVLRNRGAVYQDAVRKADLLALPLLVLGLIFLWIDLGNRWNAWRFFTTFQIGSAMSWGSWILLLASGVLAIRAVPALAATIPAERHGRLRLLGPLRTAADRITTKRVSRTLDGALLLLGTGLGLYTGILLSSISARPLWDSVWLAPLFLASGLASAGAFVCLIAIEETHHRLAPFSMALCGVEALLIVAYLGGLAMASGAQDTAAASLMGGRYAWFFWGVVVAIGLAIPLGVEIGERKQVVGATAAKAAPVMKLTGALGLRAVILFAGLASVL